MILWKESLQTERLLTPFILRGNSREKSTELPKSEKEKKMLSKDLNKGGGCFRRSEDVETSKNGDQAILGCNLWI